MACAEVAIVQTSGMPTVTAAKKAPKTKSSAKQATSVVKRSARAKKASPATKRGVSKILATAIAANKRAVPEVQGARFEPVDRLRSVSPEVALRVAMKSGIVTRNGKLAGRFRWPVVGVRAATDRRLWALDDRHRLMQDYLYLRQPLVRQSQSIADHRAAIAISARHLPR